jgi:hypothetical protein
VLVLFCFVRYDVLFFKKRGVLWRHLDELQHVAAAGRGDAAGASLSYLGFAQSQDAAAPVVYCWAVCVVFEGLTGLGVEHWWSARLEGFSDGAQSTNQWM